MKAGRLSAGDFDVWIELSAECPTLDPFPLFKVRYFAAKLRGDERKLIRLVHEAEWTKTYHEGGSTDVHPHRAIARAAGISKGRVDAILAAGLGDVNWPAFPRRESKPPLLAELEQLAAQRRLHDDKLREWTRVAHEDGWAVETLARAAEASVGRLSSMLDAADAA